MTPLLGFGGRMEQTDVGDLLDIIELQAARSPQKIAIRDRRGELTYAELIARIRRAAGALTDRSVRPGDRVALHLENSADFGVAALAALYIGAIFVPVPFTDPDDRVATIVDDAAPAVLVTRSDAAVARGSAFGNASTLLDHELGGSTTTAPRCRDKYRRAYCIYTSGSTGTPKGVVIRHDSLATVVAQTVAVFGLRGDTKALCSSPFHFDGSFGSLFSVLVAGGSLVIPEREALLLPRNYFAAVVDHGITHGTFSPSFLRLLVSSPGLERLRGCHLRTIGLGGEDCSADDIRSLRDVVPEVRVFNRYGPTEATIAVSSYEITDDALRSKPKIPVGKPHEGTEFRLIDEAGRLLDDDGPIGELCIGGRQLMDGYWNDEDLTEASLLRDVEPGLVLYRTGDLMQRDDDGDYVYVGRRDDVVNRNGTRMALGELAAALRQVPEVADAACLADRAEGDVRLSAFVVLDTPREVRDIRGDLLRRVPGYMSPDDLVVVDAIPLVPAGKPDLQRLRVLLDEHLATGS